MTRQDNSYYGINWGFRADQLVNSKYLIFINNFLIKNNKILQISDKIDAGDIFLIKYECDECL